VQWHDDQKALAPTESTEMNPISRRSLLTSAAVATGGLAAAGLAACTGTPNIARPTASPSGTVTAQLDAVMKVIANGSDKFGVWVQDWSTGGTYGFNPDYTSQSASMAKPMIVSMALRKAAADGGELSAENSELARKAITNSDNNAADTLWAYAGGRTAFDALAKDLGMTASHSDPAKDFWSWTWTTPEDQVLLANTLANGGSKALTNSQCKFTWDLMGQVEDDQTWGVGQPRSAAVAVHLKNGWVQFQSTDNLWAVNSMGGVEGEGRAYFACVMTRVPDFATGREITSEVGKWIFSILGSGKL
jgi:hypothetical protein